MSEPITEEWCQTVGLNKMTWNPKMNGGTPEYWVTTWQGKRDAYREWDSRLAIRFRWEPGEDFRVMLTAPNTGVWLHGVTTVEQFQQAYELITGKPFAKAVKPNPKACALSGNGIIPLQKQSLKRQASSRKARLPSSKISLSLDARSAYAAWIISSG